MNHIKTAFTVMLLTLLMTMSTSFANQDKSTQKTLNGIYTNEENPKSPQIEFKEDETLLLLDDGEVIQHGTYEIEEGGTLLVKLGNGRAFRFKFTKPDLSAFSHAQIEGTWKKQNK